MPRPPFGAAWVACGTPPVPTLPTRWRPINALLARWLSNEQTTENRELRLVARKIGCEVVKVYTRHQLRRGARHAASIRCTVQRCDTTQVENSKDASDIKAEDHEQGWMQSRKLNNIL